MMDNTSHETVTQETAAAAETPKGHISSLSNRVEDNEMDAPNYVIEHARLSKEQCRALNEDSDVKTPGETFILTSGRRSTVVSYRGSYKVTVELDGSGQQETVRADSLRKGNVRDRYSRSVLGVGYIGHGNTSAKDGSYKTWKHMLERCYSEKYQQKRPTYAGVTVADEWLDYGTFQQWYQRQPNAGRVGFQLDKDLRSLHDNDEGGPKSYSPENCEPVPASVNNLLLDSAAARGELPQGVTKDRKRFTARVQDPMIKSSKYLGSFGTVEAAHAVYCRAKAEIIKQVALEHGAMENISAKIVSNLVVEADRLLREADEIDTQGDTQAL